jgi:hypothetical protein
VETPHVTIRTIRAQSSPAFSFIVEGIPTLLTKRIRSFFVVADGSVGERMRLRRWSRLKEEFPDLDEMDVLDLGGTTTFWRRSPVRPRSVTVVNLDAPGEGLPWVTPITGDACNAPELLGGRTFDLVLSNSLIEHLGGHYQRATFAAVARSMAPHYAIQTPYRYFPIEPHWLFPGQQFLPLSARVWLAPRWPLGHTHGWPSAQARDEVMSTELLSLTDMRAYFPDARVIWERFMGLPKSLTLIR